jgi:hypothetical protein
MVRRALMPFVARDAHKNIVAVSETATSTCTEEIPGDSEELARYLAETSPEGLRQQLAESDLKMVRLVDDLIDVLIDKRVVQITDLPAAAAQKYLERQTARRRLQDASNLIIGEKDIL